MIVKFKTWWLLSAAGAALLVAGTFSLLNPFHAFVRAVSYSGIALSANGILLGLLAANPLYIKEQKWLIAESALDLLFAVVLMFNPLMTFVILPLVIGTWMLCIGIVKTLSAFALRKYFNGWQYVLVTGILILTFGTLISFSPIPKASGIVTLVGIFCLLLGLMNIFDALRFKSMPVALTMML